MSCGLVQLTATSNIKNELTKKPEITFFKKKIDKYKNFTILNIIQKFNSVCNFNTKTSCNLDINGDLISNIFLYIELPSIPKFPDNKFTETKNYNSIWSLNNDHINRLAWVENIGFNLIKFVELEIGTKLIDKISGEFLYIQNRITNNNSKHKNLDIL